MEQDAGQAGTVIDGRYTLRREIAIGGGARVHVAEHRYLSRAVALKLPRTDVPQTDQLRARLRREALALGMLHHPAIVQVLDAGESGGAPYIVMELLEGRSLAGLLTSRGKLGIDEVVRIGCEVARGLEACHAAGVVHRDIKPSNLFVTLSPIAPIKILDFGIAKLVGEDAPPQEKLTREESILGTPEYLAPESLLSPTTADARVDIYALAVTLYECLTGTVPFDGRFGEVLLKVSTTSAPNLIERRPEVPAALADAINRGLSRDPGDRQANATEFLEAIQACASPSTGTLNLLQHGFGGAVPAGATKNPLKATIADSPGAIRVAPPATRRKFPRAPYITPTRIVRANGESIDGRIEEVSEGGLLFVGTGPCPTGETVRVRFALPATGRIAEASCGARWTRAARGAHATGFEFLDLADDLRKSIQQYVAIMCPAP